MTLQLEKNKLLLTGRSVFNKAAVAAANAGACTIVTDVALSTLTGGVLTIAAQPDQARSLKLVVTDANASILTGTVTVTGLDQNGVPITEVVAITGAGSFYTLQAFSKVTSATWALLTGEVTAADDKVAIGYGPKLGLEAAPNAVYKRLIKGTFDGGDEAGTFDATYGCYTPAGTLNGAKLVEVLFLYELSLLI